MSTTTDHTTRTVVSVLPAVFAGWITVLVAVTAAFEPTNDVVVFGSPERTLALLDGTDIRITDVRPHMTKLRGTEPGFVRALYANGAMLVLPVKSSSCLGLRVSGP